MSDKAEFELCRLCLNSRGLLINIFGENNKLRIMLQTTIEDLIDVKVVEDENYPWLVCSNCMEKLTEFRLFKRRCAECFLAFNNRIQKECNPTTKDWITNVEECSSEIKREINDYTINSDIVDHGTVDFGDDMIIVKEEIETASECSASPLEDVGFSMASSMQEEGCSQWPGNKEAGNICPGEIKKEYCDEAITDDAIDMGAVDVPDDMIVVKQEVDAVSGCSADREIDNSSSIVASMQEGESHRSGNENFGNLVRSGGEEFIPSLNVDVVIKEECDADISQGDGDLGKEVLAVKDESQGQNGTGNLIHKCQICSEAFATRDLQTDHVMAVHRRTQFICDGCNESFESKSDIRRHVTLLHNIKPVYAVRENHHCKHCSRQFQDMSELSIHMAAHTDEMSFKCAICSKAFNEKGRLKSHVLIHISEKPFKCSICSKAFIRNSNLKKHILKHTDERPHKCQECSKVFALSSALKRHMLSHTGERSHKCGICSKAFARNSALKRHMLCHTGDRPFKCKLCSNAFAVNGALKRHMLTHTDDRPFKCEICSNEFTRNGSLKRHMLTHTGEKSHKCEICSKAFAHKRYLEVHSLAHTDERQHKCVVCSKGYKFKSKLIRHMKVHEQVDIE